MIAVQNMEAVIERQFVVARRFAWFAGLVLVSIAAEWKPLAATYVLAWRADEYTHILLILPVSLALVFLDWSSRDLFGDRRPLSGVVLLMTAFVVAGLAKWDLASLASDQRLAVSMFAMILWWVGAFALCFGATAFRRALFPLCFLWWMVPLPASWLDYLVKQLQFGSAVAASLLFSVVRTPVMHDGVRLSIPGLTLEVAKECSSIRSSLMLVVTTMVVAQLLLHSPLRKSVVVAAAIPLSIAKNGLRIFTIAMLGTKVDPAFLTGKLHHSGGFIFLAIALAAIFGTIWILRRGENLAVTPAPPLARI
jgi:exosortase